MSLNVTEKCASMVKTQRLIKTIYRNDTFEVLQCYKMCRKLYQKEKDKFGDCSSPNAFDNIPEVINDWRTNNPCSL